MNDKANEFLLHRNVKMTWLGFGGFHIQTPSGKEILIDPWIQNNPLCPEAFKEIDGCDYILLTHAHRDHAEDAVRLAKHTGATVLAGWELAELLKQRGVDHVVAINKGGTRKLGDIAVTAVHADHSSAYVEDGEILYGGEPMGYVIAFENGFKVYHAGDTNVFGDMTLIAELYAPELAMLPIGDAYTMGPREAAKAVRLLNVKWVIPTHFGWDFLTGTPQELEGHIRDLADVVVVHTRPGEAIG